MADGANRKRKVAGGQDEAVGSSSRAGRRVDAVDGVRALELVGDAEQGGASHRPIFTNSGLVVHPLPLSPSRLQPRIHARPLVCRPDRERRPSRNASQTLPIPPQFQLLSYHPPTLLSASLDADSRYLVAFFPLYLGGRLPSRRERIRAQGSLSGCLVLYDNDARPSSKPQYKIRQFWDLQSDAVDILWINQPRQWTAGDKLRRAPAPVPLPGAGDTSFMILTANGIAQLYVPQQIRPRPSSSVSTTLQCLQCPITHPSASTSLQTIASIATVSNGPIVLKSAMARSPLDGAIHVAVELLSLVDDPADISEPFGEWDWTANGFSVAAMKRTPQVELAKLTVELLASGGPILKSLPLPPLGVGQSSDGAPLRSSETAIRGLVFRHAAMPLVDENEEDDPLFASSPEDVNDKPSDTTCGLELVLALASRFDQAQRSHAAEITYRLEAYDLLKVEGSLLEGFAALTEPAKTHSRALPDRMSYRRTASKVLDGTTNVLHIQANPCHPRSVSLLTSELKDGQNRIYLLEASDLDDLPGARLIQQTPLTSFHPDDEKCVVSVSPSQARVGFGIVSASAAYSSRVDLVLGFMPQSLDLDTIVGKTSQNIACAVLQGTLFDDALLTAAIMSQQVSEDKQNLADRIVEQTWQLLVSVIPATTGVDAMSLAKDMLRVQHLSYRAFGDLRAQIAAETLKVVEANEELEVYLDSNKKDVATLSVVLPAAIAVLASLQRSIVMANGKLEWVGKLDSTFSSKLAIALNAVALSALQGFAGNLVQLLQTIPVEAEKATKNPQTLKGLLYLESQYSFIQDGLSMSGVDFEKLAAALSELAANPPLAANADSNSAFFISARPHEMEDALHTVIASLSPCSSAKLMVGTRL